MHKFTAAHRELPFGTMVKVTNLANGKSVVVRVNDRGPFKRDRIIDLSFAAGKAIRMTGTGTARVRIEIIK
jgi:rare lipoprotein A